jgi:small-conductance mechanosensitive channel
MRRFAKGSLLRGIGTFWVVWMVFSSISIAQNESPVNNYDALRASVGEALKAEFKNIENLKNQLSQAEKSKKMTLEDINAYKIQLPILNNVLIQPETTVKELEKSWLEIETAGRDLSNRINEFSTKQKTVAPLLNQNRDQVALTEKQIAEIQSDTAAGLEISSITDQLKVLLRSLAEKQEVLSSLNTVYSETISALDEKKQIFNELSGKFNEDITKRKKQELLERRTSLVSIGLKQIVEDFEQFVLQLRSVFSRTFWSGQIEMVWTSGGFYFASFVLLFLIVQGLIYQVRQYLVRQKDHPSLKERFWNRLTLSIIQKSIFLLGSTLFLYSYAQVGPFQSKPPIVWAGLNLFLVWLFSEGCIDALKLYCGEDATTVPQKPAFHLRLLISTVRWFGLSYIIFAWLSGSTTVLVVWRMLFEICLYVWVIFFWNTVQNSLQSDFPERSPRLSATVMSLKFLSFLIVLIALILELSGYGMLALYWLVSWGRTVVVVLWSLLAFFVLREWNPKIEKHQETAVETPGVPRKSIQWAAVQFSMLVWFGGVIICLVLAWGGKQSVLLGIFDFLQHTHQVGAMRFSLMGFIVAILILLLTQAVARIWQHVFRQNILNQSGMEEGLQDSITTISVYVVWSVGILISLNAFGFNATSLTVVLGALGIGLGFGLQTIFNNFISGIILLFERPFQVGDDIEVNGTWAQVRKINVRSTLVQTYDNASLIIPNSDLLSSQVTNWSFKDKRLRRNVSVGVAYGSDVELVRSTLMEVAEKTPRILRLPRPDVVFMDFGDSALIFKLRFWTRVEYFLAVETDVRFKIDRLFRERNIEIAFPQQDIHIRSGLKDEKPVSPQTDSPDLAGESGKGDS